MTDEELEQRLHDELQDRISPPYSAPDTLRQRVGSLQMLEPVRLGSGRGIPHAFRKPRILAAAAVVVLLIGASFLFRQSWQHQGSSVKLPASFQTFGRIDGNAAWVEAGADLYITGDDGETWTKGTLPARTSSTSLSPQSESYGAAGDLMVGQPYAPVFVDADHGWLVSWTVANAGACQEGDWTLTVWRTSDGAQTWQSAQLPGIYKGYGTVQFTDTEHGWVTVGRIGPSACPQQGNGGPVSGPEPTTVAGFSLATPAPTPTPSPLPDDVTTVLSTSDGGATWSRASTLAAFATFAFAGTDEAWGYGSSENGRWDLALHSTDGARTWTSAQLPLPDGAGLTGIGEQVEEDGGTATLRVVAYESGPAPNDVFGSLSGAFSPPAFEILSFVSGDGGKTWKLDATRAVPGEFPNLLAGPSTIVQRGLTSQPIATIENGWIGGGFGGPVSSGTPQSFQATFNGGVSWQSYSTKGLPRTVTMAEWTSPDDVWVLSNGDPTGSSGSAIYIYTTRDGGNTWTGLGGAPRWPASPLPNMTPHPLLPDVSLGVVPTSPPTLEPQNSLLSMGRVDARVGWVEVSGLAQSDLRITTDGGSSWSEPRPLPGHANTSLMAADIQFVDANRGWLVDSGAAAGVQPQPGSRRLLMVFRTSDGGRSWQTAAVDMGNVPDGVVDSSTGWITSAGIHFRDATHGELYSTVAYGSGPDASARTEWSTACTQASTTDGGATWSAPRDGACVSQFAFSGSSEGYGQNWDAGPTLSVTSDGGQTWVTGSLPPSKLAALGDFGVSPVLMVERRLDGSLRALVESYGSMKLDVSTDGGKTWVESASVGLDGAASYKVARLREGNWIALQTNPDPSTSAAVWVTSDGGLTWTPLASTGLSPMANGIAFVGPTDGWVAGLQSKCLTGADGGNNCQSLTSLLGTSDSGLTWSTILTP